MTQTQTLTLMFQTGGLRLDLVGHFVSFIKVERTSNYAHFWTYVWRLNKCTSVSNTSNTRHSRRQFSCPIEIPLVLELFSRTF